MKTYHHTQIGWLTLIALPAIGAITTLALTFARLAPAALLVWGVLILTAVLFCSLTVELQGDVLRCRFNLGLIRKTFRLAEIRDAQAVRNHWYYGWGIRLIPHGWMFNVSGLDAVELTLASGKKFRIGTDEPQKLVAAIRPQAGWPDSSNV